MACNDETVVVTATGGASGSPSSRPDSCVLRDTIPGKAHLGVTAGLVAERYQKQLRKEGIPVQDQTIVEDGLSKETKEECLEAPAILEEITMEEMAVDGICGIY